MNRFNIYELLCLGLAIYAAITLLIDIYSVYKNNKNTNNEKMKYNYFDIAFSTSFFVIAITFTFILAPVYVSGESMEPTYQDKDFLIENKLTKNYKVGDIVVFYAPQKNKKLIKRIVAEGGDTVEVKNLKLYVNGEEVKEDYPTIQFEVDFPALTVPEGEFFVLGDNRPISLDSRYEVIGCVSPEYIEGEVISFKN